MCVHKIRGRKEYEGRREEREETTDEILRALGDYGSGLAKLEARRLSSVHSGDPYGLSNMRDLNLRRVVSIKCSRSTIREATNLWL